MIHAPLLCLEVAFVFRMHGAFNVDPFQHGDALRLQGPDLEWIVGHEPDRLDAEVFQDPRGKGVFPLVRLVSQHDIGVHRIVSFVLQVVGFDLLGQADAAPLLAHVDNHAPAGFRDPAERQVKLFAAVAAQGSEHIPGEAFRMHPGEHFPPVREVPHDKGQVGLVVAGVDEVAELEFAVPGGNSGFGGTGNGVFWHGAMVRATAHSVKPIRAFSPPGSGAGDQVRPPGIGR